MHCERSIGIQMKGKCQSLLSLQHNKMSTSDGYQRPKTARQPTEESNQRPLSARYLGSSEETNQRPKTARCLGIRSKLNPVVALHKETLVILRCIIILTDIIQFSLNQGEQTGRLWCKAPGSDQGRQDERVSQEKGKVRPLTDFLIEPIGSFDKGMYDLYNMAFKTTHNKDESLPQFMKSSQLIFSHN